MKTRFTVAALLAAAAATAPVDALTVTPTTTEGPYYTMSSANTVINSSSANYAAQFFTTDGTDNDLIHVYSTSTAVASGTITKLSGTLVNTSGTAISGAVIELWVADNNGIYWYVSSSSGTNNYANRDKNFQGYGKCTTDSTGAWSFLTIKPGLYTGRIRHYHIKVRINGTEYLTTQLMPASEAAATPSDMVVSGLGSNLSRCTYTPTTGTITWGSATYSGQIVSDRQLVVNYAVTVTKPAITTQPVAQSVTAGASATFTVAASGTAPFTYQWYKDTAAISGATDATYTIATTTTASAGSYYCIVTNSAGTATTNSVALTVTNPATAPSITKDPTSQTVDVGAAVAFEVQADGTTPMSYQWYKGTATISGATAASYNIASAKLADAGDYYVIVSNTAGSGTSGTATLSVNEPFKTFLNYYGISSATATDDTDGDGIPNILEFILGGDPKTPDASIRPTVAYTTTDTGSTALTFSFYAVKELGTASWAVEYNTALSSDASTWTTATAGTNGVTIVTQETETAGLSYVTVTIPTTETKLFARLRVTPPAQ